MTRKTQTTKTTPTTTEFKNWVSVLVVANNGTKENS